MEAVHSVRRIWTRDEPKPHKSHQDSETALFPPGYRIMELLRGFMGQSHRASRKACRDSPTWIGIISQIKHKGKCVALYFTNRMDDGRYRVGEFDSAAQPGEPRGSPKQGAGSPALLEQGLTLCDKGFIRARKVRIQVRSVDDALHIHLHPGGIHQKGVILRAT